MTIFAQSKQDHIKLANRTQCLSVAMGRLRGAHFCRDDMPLLDGYGHVIEPGLGGHARIARGVIGRQAALVTEIDMPGSPIYSCFAQPAIDTARRISPGEYQVKFGSFLYGLGGACKYRRYCRLLQCRFIGDPMPAARFDSVQLPSAVAGAAAGFH